MNEKYQNIINLKRPVSNHPKMSLASRAAKFSPFNALTGYEEKIKETSKLTTKKIELSPEQIDCLNSELTKIIEHIEEKPQVTITYFVPNEQKGDGSYQTRTGFVFKIDNLKKCLYLTDKTIISLDCITTISLN